MEGSLGLRKGAWAKVEDDLLRACIQQYGEGKWHLVPSRAGLNRCRKSCRLRWLNYLKPNIKRGEFADDEVDLMIRMHRLLGNRWSLIAGRLPGRTPNDVKNYWNTYVRRNNKHNNNNNKPTLSSSSPTSLLYTPTRKDNNDVHHHPQVIKPHPRTFSKASASAWLLKKTSSSSGDNDNNKMKEGLLLHHQVEVDDDEEEEDEDGTNYKEADTENNNGCRDTCRQDEKLLNGGWFISSAEQQDEEDWKLMLSDFNWDDHHVNNVHHGDADHDMLMMNNNLEGQTWSDILLDINLWDQQ